MALVRPFGAVGTGQRKRHFRILNSTVWPLPNSRSLPYIVLHSHYCSYRPFDSVHGGIRASRVLHRCYPAVHGLT